MAFGVAHPGLTGHSRIRPSGLPTGRGSHPLWLGVEVEVCRSGDPMCRGVWSNWDLPTGLQIGTATLGSRLAISIKLNTVGGLLSSSPGQRTLFPVFREACWECPCCSGEKVGPRPPAGEQGDEASVRGHLHATAWRGERSHPRWQGRVAGLPGLRARPAAFYRVCTMQKPSRLRA